MNNKDLKKRIDDVVKANGQGEITGPDLNHVLDAIIDAFAVGSVVKGLATPDTQPGAPDGRVCYFTTVGGNYPNFGLSNVPAGLGLVMNAWNEMGEMSWKYQNLSAELSRILNDKASSITTDVANKYNELKKDIDTINQTLTNHEGRLKNIEEFNAFVQTHIETQGDINKAQEQTNSLLKSNIQSLDGDVKANRADINTNSDKIATLATASDKHEANLETLNKDNGKNKADIVALQTDVEKKAYRDGYYPEMTSGRADNLIGGIDVSQKFTRGVVADGKAIDGKVGRIQKYKGNSVVWNQQINQGGIKTFEKVVPDSTTTAFDIDGTDFISKLNHIYYVNPNMKPDENFDSPEWIYPIWFGSDSGAFEYTKPFIFNLKSQYEPAKGNARFGVRCKPNTHVKFTYNFILIDLTQMFGAGNEPSLQEFESWFQLPYYDYNEGTIVNYNATGIKSVGFNLWDEQWIAGEKNITSKNPILIPSEVSQLNITLDKVGAEIDFYIYQTIEDYRKNKNGKYYSIGVGSSAISLPKGNKVAVFSAYKEYGTVYNHDICINISDPAHNGEYHPYMETTKALDIQSIKGEDGQPLFPNGLCSAGNVHDEITATKAIKRVGTVDLGTLGWSIDPSSTGGIQRFTSSMVSNVKILDAGTVNNVLSVKYIAASFAGTNTIDKSVGINRGGNVLIKDTDYLELKAFKDSIIGQILYYELKEPIVVDLPTPLNLDIDVENHGTLTTIPEETPTPVTSPTSADIVYSMDVVGAVKGLPQDYISKASMENFLGQLGQAQGGTWNMVWDAETGKYNFNFAKTQSIDVPPESVQE